MRREIAILVLATGLATAAGAAELPAKLAPTAIAGSGFNVRDLEGQRAWYQDKLGMRLINTMRRQDKPFEYLMGYDPKGPIVALLSSPNRPPGPNQMSRLILQVPDAKGLADHLKTGGLTVREVIPGTAYFLADPEGNPIELYTPPKPAK